LKPFAQPNQCSPDRDVLQMRASFGLVVPVRTAVYFGFVGIVDIAGFFNEFVKYVSILFEEFDIAILVQL
jgi:hypothetical protein